MEFILNMLTLKCLHNIRDDFQESMPMLGSEVSSKCYIYWLYVFLFNIHNDSIR